MATDRNLRQFFAPFVLLGAVLLSALVVGDLGANEPIVRYDLTPLRKLDLGAEAARNELWDTCHLVASLQGLANRSRPRLYLTFIEPWDSFWLSWLRSPGHWLADREVEEIATLETLLDRFGDSSRGVVLYAQEPASLSNVASTIAGCEDLLPVRKDASPGSLYTRLVSGGPKLPVVIDLTSREFHSAPGSPKCAPYLWAKEQYLDSKKCDPAHLAYYIDTFWLQPPFRGSHENHTLTNHDFFISKKAFFFDLHPWDDEVPNDDPGQAIGTDAQTLMAVLRSAYAGVNGETIIHAGGFVPWAWKYTDHVKGASKHGPVATEWRYAEILSCYNVIMDADALGPCAMSNASFYTHYPLEDHYPQPATPTGVELTQRGFLGADGLVEPGAYICLYLGDYDSAAWLYREFPRCWNDSARGKVPLGWALDPNLEVRAPMVLAYARETRTPLDVFTTGDSGAGYLNPGGLQEPRHHSGLPSGVKVWEDFCRPLYRRWDLRVTGFIIDGHSAPMGEELWDAYARFSPGGIVGQKMPSQGLRKGLPFLRMSDAAGSPEQTAAQFAALASPERRSFYYVRTILKTASWHKEFADRLKEKNPAAHVVDPHTFFALLGLYEGHRDRYPKPVWTRAELRWSPERQEGLRLVPLADGPIAHKSVRGRRAIVSNTKSRALYIYAAAHDGFSAGRPETLVVEVSYLDTDNNRFCIQYNGVDSAYTSSRWIELEGSETWRDAKIVLRNAQLSNQQNGGCDLRLVNERGRLVVSKVVLHRKD